MDEFFHFTDCVEWQKTWHLKTSSSDQSKPSIFIISNWTKWRGKKGNLNFFLYSSFFSRGQNSLLFYSLSLSLSLSLLACACVHAHPHPHTRWSNTSYTDIQPQINQRAPVNFSKIHNTTAGWISQQRQLESYKKTPEPITELSNFCSKTTYLASLLLATKQCSYTIYSLPLTQGRSAKFEVKLNKREKSHSK